MYLKTCNTMDTTMDPNKHSSEFICSMYHHTLIVASIYQASNNLAK